MAELNGCPHGLRNPAFCTLCNKQLPAGDPDFLPRVEDDEEPRYVKMRGKEEWRGKGQRRTETAPSIAQVNVTPPCKSDWALEQQARSAADALKAIKGLGGIFKPLDPAIVNALQMFAPVALKAETPTYRVNLQKHWVKATDDTETTPVAPPKNKTAAVPVALRKGEGNTQTMRHARSKRNERAAGKREDGR